MKIKSTRADSKPSWIVRHKWQILAFIVAFAVFFLRRTGALLHPQFWAEDGMLWFQSAFNSHYSITILAHPNNGYLSVFPRLVALLSGFFSLHYAPLFFNVCALIVQALPLIYLWSERTDYMSKKMKLFISVVYVLIPYTAEIDANITNSQWFLAVLLFLLLFVKESSSHIVQAIDRLLVIISACSGPFVILLTPVVFIEWWRTKKFSSRYYFFFAGALLQLFTLLTYHNRSGADANLGATPDMFLRLLSGQIFGAGLYGYKSITYFLSHNGALYASAALGLAVLVFVFIKSKNWQLRYFVIFALLVFLFGLISPNNASTAAGQTRWQALLEPNSGGRYYFILHLAVLVCLGWILLGAAKIPKVLRAAAAVVLLSSLIIGVPRDFTYPSYADLHYQSYIKKYDVAPKGQTIVVPINPGLPWQIDLKKN